MSEIGTSTWRFPSKVETVDNAYGGELFDEGGYWRASLGKATAQNISSTSWTKISWDGSNHNYPVGWTIGTNPTRYTCQESGLYLVVAYCLYRSTRTDFKLQIINLKRDNVNKGFGKRTGASNANGHWNAGQVSHVMPFVADEYLEIEVYQRNTGAATVPVTARVLICKVGGLPT